MTTEDYVSFETAKLLKDKGFDGECNSYYDEFGLVCPTIEPKFANLEHYKRYSLNVAMKWLREVHNLQIQIAPINSRYKDWAFGIYKDFSPLTIKLICCPTYEEACEAAIKYCLENLI